jgi:hypothetical protein
MTCGFKTAIVSCMICYDPKIRSSMQSLVFDSKRRDVIVAAKLGQLRWNTWARTLAGG